MIDTHGNGRQSVFSWWLRTGKLPHAAGPDGLECKSNPWHDPADGRFTFAGQGRHDGANGADGAIGNISVRIGHAPGMRGRHRSRTVTPAEAPRTSSAAGGHAETSAERRSRRVQAIRMAGSRPVHRHNPVAEFVVGAGQGVYAVGKQALTAVHDTLTTNPATTIRDAGHAIASMIDTAIAAEDTPAHVQVSRAAAAVANASARDIGRAAGSVAGNVALTLAPGGALSRTSTLRRLRRARPRTPYNPPRIGWVKETIKADKPWKRYNDGATGAREGQAPTLMRTMPDGSTRPVKFDGFDGDYVIDRKWKVVNAPHARAQILRQSDVLAQHGLVGTWEVPTPAQQIKGRNLLKKMNVNNIKVRMVKP